ncbi:MAG: ferrochelatase [Deltaproteobacteria bacterium RIFOXYD12_FULL_55_16]|nr:MAG: ferrochelatase [Deltaproteobacteria bacterium RIFOXYD12_FULL_55_16]
MAETIGVVLLNLGGPETLAEVEPFLFNLFSDRQIIKLSPFPFLQKFIAGRIAAKRAPKSREAYQLIGGGSPLARITGEQCRALAAALAEQGDFRVSMAMRYWQPGAEVALAEFARAGIRRLVALTLYPHYSRATTGSSLDDLRKAVAVSGHAFELVEIREWPEQPEYVACLAQGILAGMAGFGGEEAQLVYSAHSLPVSFIREGDPYLEQIRRTIAAVEKIIGLEGRLCFQSRSGPVEWLTPSTPQMLERLAAEGCRNILMVPISFVSDHVETLYEIDIQYKELAGSLGLRLERSASLNTAPEFIRGLSSLVFAACRQKGWR